MPRIYFFTSWNHIPRIHTVGGPKVLQQNVRILRANGFDAHIVLGPGRKWWSRLAAHEQRIALKRKDFERRISAEDVVVVPAVHSHRLDRIPGRRKVIMVQNGGLLFDAFSLEQTPSYPWHDSTVEGVICVSERDRQLVRLATPACTVYRVYNSVDPDRFRPLPWSEREHLILASSLTVYKNPWHVKALCHMVRSRAESRSRDRTLDASRVPTIRVVQGLKPAEVSDLLGRARALVFLSVNEGFGLLPLEALVAGTPVIGYRRQAYGEFMPDSYLHGVSDFEGMVEQLEMILALRPDDPWHRIREEARKTSLAYSARRQESSVVETWSRILSR